MPLTKIFEIEDHLRYHKINYDQKRFGYRGEFIWNQLLEDMVNQRVDWVYLNLNWTTDFPASVILYYNVQLNGFFFNHKFTLIVLLSNCHLKKLTLVILRILFNA